MEKFGMEIMKIEDGGVNVLLGIDYFGRYLVGSVIKTRGA